MSEPWPRRWTLYDGGGIGADTIWNPGVGSGPALARGETVEVMPVAEHEKAVAELVEELRLVSEQRDMLAARIERLEADLSADAKEALDAIDDYAAKNLDHEPHSIVEHYRQALGVEQ